MLEPGQAFLHVILVGLDGGELLRGVRLELLVDPGQDCLLFSLDLGRRFSKFELLCFAEFSRLLVQQFLEGLQRQRALVASLLAVWRGQLIVTGTGDHGLSPVFIELVHGAPNQVAGEAHWVHAPHTSVKAGRISSWRAKFCAPSAPRRGTEWHKSGVTLL